MNKSSKQMLIGAAVAGIMAMGISSTAMAKKGDKVKAAKAADGAAKVECVGKNECKGHGGCKSAAECKAGANSCKNHVFHADSKEDCKGKNGEPKA